MPSNTFEIDVAAIRDDARSQMADGPVTVGNTVDTDQLLDVLNQVVATEMVCVMRYTQNAIAASGIDKAQVAREFSEHARDEMQHGLRAAERVSQLGGSPDSTPRPCSHAQYSAPEATDLQTMLRENLVAERIVMPRKKSTPTTSTTC